jgi:hypothetical protein
MELIEPTHPLIQWIRADYTKDHRQLHPVVAVKLDAAKANAPPGDYVFVAHRWSLVGLRSDHLLSYRATSVNSAKSLDVSASEDLLVGAARDGRAFVNAPNLVGALNVILDRALACEEKLEHDFAARVRDFESENNLRCGQQETSARRFAERRMAELSARIERYREQGSTRLIPMTEGLLQKEEARLRTKLMTVAQRRMVDPTIVPLAAGIIRVE